MKFSFKAKTGDFVLSAISVIVGIAIIFLTNYQKLKITQKGMPGPGMFPIICGIAISVCGVLLLVETLRNKDNESVTVVNTYELKNLLVFLIMGAVVLFLTDMLGLLICLFLCMVFYLLVMGKEPIWKAVIISLACSAFLYAVFIMLLHVPVPKGPLGF